MNQVKKTTILKEEYAKDTTEDTFESDEMQEECALEPIDIWEETLKWFQDRQILPGNPDVLRCSALPSNTIKPFGKGLCMKKLSDRLQKKKNTGAVEPESSSP